MENPRLENYNTPAETEIHVIVGGGGGIQVLNTSLTELQWR